MDAIGRNEVIALYREGHCSRNRLAVLAQCSRAVIDRILTEAGLDLVPSFLDTSRVEGILADYEAGASVRDVADAYGVSRATASTVLRSHGVLRPRGRPRGKAVPLVALGSTTILTLHARGGVGAVVDAAHCSTATAYRLLRQARALHAGVPL